MYLKLNKVRLRHENGRITTDFTKRAKTDQSLKGIKNYTKKIQIERRKKQMKL